MGSTSTRGSCSSTLPAYRDLGISTLLRGHAGELLHMRKAYAFSLDDAALSARDESALDAWLWPHLSDYMVGAVDGPLFVERRRRSRSAGTGPTPRCGHALPRPQT